MKNLLLPVGEYKKEEIRNLAHKYNLPIADKPDSQEICFIPDDNYRQFIIERTNPKPGKILDINGNLLGNHEGIQSFTIGQRRKLGIDNNSAKPYFVLKISKSDNNVYVGPHEYLFQTNFNAVNINIQSNQLNLSDFDAYQLQIFLI